MQITAEQLVVFFELGLLHMFIFALAPCHFLVPVKTPETLYYGHDALSVQRPVNIIHTYILFLTVKRTFSETDSLLQGIKNRHKVNRHDYLSFGNSKER